VRSAIAATVVLAAIGCARRPAFLGPHLPDDALPVPIVSQATSYSCGAAALAAILYYWQVSEEGEAELYDRLDTTPQMGTEPEKIVEVARAYGLEASAREGWTVAELQQALQGRQTVIIDLQAWPDEPKDWSNDWDDGHYVVLIGMDLDRVYVMDPSSPARYAWLPVGELDQRWHDIEGRGPALHPVRAKAIAIHGKNPLTSQPAPLVRLE
jgi:predicted double-glycine peptidase